MTPGDTTIRIESWLVRLRGGDPAAREQLLAFAAGRLSELARRLLRRSPRVRRWEETDDVFQNAMMRLCRALREVTPGSMREFLALAATQIRRELIDLARHHYGPLGEAGHHATEWRDPAAGVSDAAGPPDRPGPRPEADAAFWIDFHESVDRLPVEEREVLDLLWYQGLTQPEAASVLGISERTVARRWQAVRLRLAAGLDLASPE